MGAVAVENCQLEKIGAVLGRLKGVKATKYVENFKSLGITDEMVPWLSEGDWKVLIPDMRVKVLFKKEFMGGVAPVVAPHASIQTLTPQPTLSMQKVGSTVNSMQKQTVTTSASY